MTDQTILRDAILTSVPGDGSTIGNQSLLEQLHSQFPQLAEDMFWAVRDALIDEGLLAKGRGRGGAVRRTDGAEQAPSSLAEQALSKALARFAPEQDIDDMDDAEDQPELPAKKKSSRNAAESSQTSSTLQDLQKTLWATAD